MDTHSFGAWRTSHLFVFPLDRRREWYRYHALFREFLLDELHRTEPDIVPKLHLRAADWYESNGSPSRAVEHLLRTAERERCVQLVTALVLPTYSAGQMSTVQRWIATLGEVSIEEYPPLAVLAGWIAALTGETLEAERWAAFVDAASFDQVPLDGTASFDSSRGMLRAVMCAAGPEQMMTAARLAVDEEPAWSPWRDTALVLLAEANLMAGDLGGGGRPVRGISQSSALSWAIPTRSCSADPSSACSPPIATSGRKPRNGWNRRWQRSRNIGCTTTSCRCWPSPARRGSRLHRGDLEDTNRQLARAMRGRATCTYAMPWLAVRVRFHLAKVYAALADTTTARHLLREIDDVFLHRPSLGTLVDEVEEFRRTLVSSAPKGVPQGPPLSPAELRLLPYLQTHLTSAEIAGRLFVSHNTIRSQVSSIYRKFGVSSRSDAVEHATAIGLVGG